MKLSEALEIGKDCGLLSAKECILNIEIHSTMFFKYADIQKELDELHMDYRKKYKIKE